MLQAAPSFAANPKRVLARTRQLSEEPHELRAPERGLILEAIRSGCTSRGWNVLAVHVRTMHVHIVVAGQETPEKIMTAAKAYASRVLNARREKETRKWWTRHGSTLYLWRREHVSAAIHYVVEEQGGNQQQTGYS
jgi:REP element-mobilizing transposase RayT